MSFKKFYLNEAFTDLATNMENVIVDAWNGKKIFPPELQNVGDNIVKFLKTQKINGNAEQLGRGSYTLTPDWKKWGAKNTTPKTDIKIGKARISLKVAPSAQLMSGSKEESLATFMNVLSDVELKENQKKVVDDIIETFNRFITGICQGTVAEVIKKNRDAVVVQGDIAHKEMMVKLNNFFAANDEFKTLFASEAMSGFKKFGPSNIASATHFLTISKDGTQSTLHQTTDHSYAQKIAGKINMSVRFKSTSVKQSSEKTGEYRYWSVVGLVVNKLLEEYDNYNGIVLTENIISNIWSKLKDFVTNIYHKIKKFIGDNIEKAIEFLGLVPVIVVNPVIDL